VITDANSDEAKQAARDYFATRQSIRELLDTGERKAPMKAGAYMAVSSAGKFKLVSYDSHCAACHPLTLSPAVSEGPQGTGKNLAVPHGKQLDELEGIVAGLLQGRKPVRGPDLPPLGLPGKSPSFSGADPAKTALRALLEGKRACGECHVGTDGLDLSVSSQKIAPPNLNVQWYEHARFDHHRHREIDCQKCHSEAGPAKAHVYATAEESRQDEDLKRRDIEWRDAVRAASAGPRAGAEKVLIPGIKNCRECHTPNPTPDAVSRGLTARYDCTECHSYHHGKAPGRTALRRESPRVTSRGLDPLTLRIPPR
jgi:hypothetical protein